MPDVDQIMVAEGSESSPGTEEVKIETVDHEGGGGFDPSSLNVSTNTPADADEIVTGESGTWFRKAFSKVWDYIKAKLGISAQGSTGKYLDEQGNFTVPPDTKYTLPLATNGTRGGIQIGYSQTGKNYPLELDGEKAYVNVPWSNTTYGSGDGIAITSHNKITNNGVQAIVVSGNYLQVTKGTTQDGDNTESSSTTNLTVPYATSAGSATDSTKVAKAGDTMSGTLNAYAENNVAISFRNNSTYYTTASYQTAGNEALVMATKAPATSFIFINGEDSVTNHASNRWQSLTPALQIKGNKVAIGKLIANGNNLTYPLEVNGDVSATNFRGSLIGNASTATKATKDGSGNTITSTYLTPSFKLGSSQSVSLPYTATAAGVLYAAAVATAANGYIWLLVDGVSAAQAIVPVANWNCGTHVVVGKGAKVTHANANVGTVTYIFRPFAV